MRIVSTTYISAENYNRPEDWLKRLRFFTGILDKLSKEHEVHSIEQIDYEGEVIQHNVRYHFLNFKRRKLYFPFRLHKYIQKLKPDIVFVSGFIFPLQIIQLRLKLGKAVKIIVINRSEKPFTGPKKYWQRLAYKYINAYLFPSAEFGKLWVKNGNINSLNKIHEAMHGSSFFSPMDKIASRSDLSVTGSPIYLWVGRLNANKDPVTVVKAFIQFLKIQPSAKLYMIYHTEELSSNIKELIQANVKAKEAIELIGKIPHHQMQTWYSAADFIISGSHYEGGGIAVCEAMSCGCIPIMTDIVSFRKFSGPGKCGLLYKAGDEKALLTALSQTLQLDKEKERINVLQQFREELSFEAINRKIQTVISSL